MLHDVQIPAITESQDIVILKNMIDCTVGGRLTLPSGLCIPTPPPGKVWHINRGAITVRDRPKEEE